MSYYLEMILANTGYTLDELVRGGVMNGRVVDHSTNGDCGCRDASGNDMSGDGTHYHCSCSHPIRWAYEVTYVPTGETFDFGSTCILNWKIRCPDCDSVKKFDECRTNTIDQYYRCLECDAVFFKTRRELKKQLREKLKREEEQKERLRQLDILRREAEERERVRQEKQRQRQIEKQEEEQRERQRQIEKQEEEKKLNRRCLDCGKFNIPKTLEAYRIRCLPCYTQFNKRKRLTL